ncbi:MAG TPA: bifunctional phosphopantothenoylcysteine decarboxylase/phosphopantothenate--cysteine ligase CoaBC [Acidimicrobiia bacterium]|nr:bifunctional phosphopantothenoylcysteine decarboxylase/phosphopantothenate--cysteine ligase CoaBC [Acidimicrobiia bacterium]
MSALSGRRIVLVVTGGVAAYKSAYLARLLVEGEAEVRVVITEEATNFIGPTTFAAITGQPVVRSLFSSGQVSPHTELGRWAEAIIVAPATAATLARLALGISEEAASATLLASTAPVLLAPAMHTEMWENPATQRNLALLRQDGRSVVGPETGALAGGDEGIGRMAEPEVIVEALIDLLAGPLSGLTVLVTAGGTREAIDPVRFLGNRSSGKMGHAIADEAARRGARVHLVTAADRRSHPAVDLIRVESAQEMAEAVDKLDVDIAIMAAAVADFRPKDPRGSKLSRSEGPPDIALEPTPDILSAVLSRSKRPFVVGFSAETSNISRAVEKALRKGSDLTVANDVDEPGAGFGVDTNRVSIISAEGDVEEWPLLSKDEVAARLWDLIQSRLNP